MALAIHRNGNRMLEHEPHGEGLKLPSVSGLLRYRQHFETYIQLLIKNLVSTSTFTGENRSWETAAKYLNGELSYPFLTANLMQRIPVRQPITQTFADWRLSGHDWPPSGHRHFVSQRHPLWGWHVPS